jgi:hypothetical protein
MPVGASNTISVPLLIACHSPQRPTLAQVARLVGTENSTSLYRVRERLMQDRLRYCTEGVAAVRFDTPFDNSATGWLTTPAEPVRRSAQR